MLPSISAAKRLGVVLFASMLAICTSAFAQESTGQIGGTVYDVTNAVIGGARIVAESPNNPRPIETSSDAQGAYVLPSLRIGVYSVTVSKAGFTTLKQNKLEVSLGSRVDFSPRLAVGSVSQTVEVSESAISLDVTSARTATSITKETFDGLPHTHNFNSLLLLAPGVRLEPKSGNAGVGGISVDGASGSENVFIIDGVEVSDTLNGSLRGAHNVPFEFLREISVKSAGFEAEFGGATGGVVNLSTRSGTNEFHGEAAMSYGSNQLNSRPRGFYQGSPLNADALDFFAPKKDSYRTFFPAVTIGGPILKNRLYFFGGWVPEFFRAERVNRYGGTVGTRNYTRETVSNYALGKVDYAASSKIQVFSSWLWSPTRIKGALPTTDTRIAAPNNDQSVVGGFSPAQSYTASFTYTPTARWVISVRYGYKYLNDKPNNYGISGDPYISYVTASAASPLPVPAAYAGANGFSNVSSTLAVARDITTRHNLYVDSSYLLNKWGQHSLKFGYALNRQAEDINSDYTNGRFQIYWGDKFSRGSVTNFTGPYGYYIWQDGVRSNSDVHGVNQGFYLQDAWRPVKNLTINIGLRVENEYLPPYKKVQAGLNIQKPIAFGWGDKLAPRLAAAWDVRGDGKWKLSGSFNTTYDVMKFNLAQGSFGGQFWVSHVYSLDSPNVYSLGKANPGALGKEIINYDNRTVDIDAQGVILGNDPNLKPYGIREYSVGLDHQIATRLVAGVRYTRKTLIRSIDDIGVLDAQDNEVYLIGNAGYGLTRDTSSVYGQKTPNGKEFLVPKATRDYDGLEFSVRGQAARNLNINASYTYSRLYGNYAGLANSDENGRSNPNNDRAFDLPFYYFDASGSQKNVYGRLATDRPHTLKLFATYNLNTRAGSTIFGLNQIAYSGTPLSTSAIYQSAPTYPNGRGDLGRTPVLTQTDLTVSHSIKVSERYTLKLEANAQNLLNQGSAVNYQTQINRSGAITAAQLPVSKFFAGYNLSQFVGPANLPGNAKYQPSFNLPISYQGIRELRFGVRLIF
jgi:hypothetical protein